MKDYISTLKQLIEHNSRMKYETNTKNTVKTDIKTQTGVKQK